MPKLQVQSWFDMWAERPDLRKGFIEARPAIRQRLLDAAPGHRWQHKRGAIGSIILTLWSYGWGGAAADTWTDAECSTWALGR
eukprot:454013-Pyramimonas_sp.AAC.1